MNYRLPKIGTRPLVAILAAAALNCFGGGDPIAELALELRVSSGSWVNGLSPIITLPPTATVEQVAAEYFKKTGFDAGRVQRFDVLRTSNVALQVHSTNTMCAALVDTDLGRKILLMEPTSPAPSWWTKCFDVPQTPDEIFAKLSERLRAAAPDAAITTNDATLTASFQTMTFKVHGRFMTGEIAKEARDETGPTHTGFLLNASLQPKGEANQAVTPQTLQRPYWLTDLDVTPVAGSDRQLYWSLSYGSRADTNTLAKLRAAVRSLGPTAPTTGKP